MYLILGLARTGLSTAKFLYARGIDFAVFDDDELRMEKAGALGYKLLDEDLIPNISKIILSPGVPIQYPEPHPILSHFKDVPTLTDTLFFQEFTPHAKFIGITGTNGKSTTTALITHALKDLGYKAYMGGNIGIPVCDLPLDGDVYVYELSSFQLERASPHKLDIACWINFSSDHIVEHGTMENYFKAKQKIFDAALHKICGVDDGYPGKYTGDDCVKVSIHDPLFANYTHPYLKGKHNLENIIIAFHALKAFGIEEAAILKSMESFKGLSHRQQHLGTKGHITFINDSKATSAAAAQTALEAYQRNYWILGGKAKSDGIESLSSYFPGIMKAFTFGDAAISFKEILDQHGVATLSFETLDQAFAEALKQAETESHPINILFSPACASFDQYKDFEKRGEHFIKLVQPLFDDEGKAPLLKGLCA